MIIRCYHCGIRRHWWMTVVPHMCDEAVYDWAQDAGVRPSMIQLLKIQRYGVP